MILIAEKAKRTRTSTLSHFVSFSSIDRSIMQRIEVDLLVYLIKLIEEGTELPKGIK